MSEETLLRIFSRNLRYYMNKNDLDPSDIAKICNVTKASVSNWVNGKKMPRSDKVDIIAKHLDIPLSILMSETTAPSNTIPIPPTTEFVNIPVIGKVAAGMNCLAEENIIDYEPTLKSDVSGDGDYVYLRVQGNSMYPKFEEGDLVLVRLQTSVDSGSYAVVIIDGEESVIKQVVYDKDWIELRSINPMYPPRRFENEDILRVYVYGLVKYSKRKF